MYILIKIAQSYTSQTTDPLSACDSHGTPLVLKLARQGDVKTLLRLAENASSGQFLFAKDSYGNNIFHVAKNANTLQATAALIRRFFGIKAPYLLRKLVNETNALGETPLHAQINDAHADTFRSIYPYSSLKQKNEDLVWKFNRLNGMDESLVRTSKELYCRDFIAQATAPGQKNILQAAQDQVAYNPQMIEVVQSIKRRFPCFNPAQF